MGIASHALRMYAPSLPFSRSGQSVRSLASASGRAFI